jgi:thiol:disulfide interchange protein DsbD
MEQEVSKMSNGRSDITTFLVACTILLGLYFFYPAGQDSNIAFAAEETLKEKAKFTTIMEKYGLVLAILFSFWWGLLANVGSACVYPMVPITIGYFAAQAETHGKGYTLLLAWMYVLGIATLYAPLGVISALAGRDVGALLGNPFFIGPFVAFLVAMSLSMFGLYEIRLPTFLMDKLSAGDRKTGIIGTFIMGIIMGFVAAPCVGPFAGSILAFVATTGNVLVGLASLFFFSLGLGIPYLILAVSAKSLASIPRAGEWMGRTKQFAGLVLLLVAVYFLSFVIPRKISLLLAGALIVIIGAFLSTLSWRQTTPLAISGRVVGTLAGIYGMLIFLGPLGLAGLYGRVPVLNHLPLLVREAEGVGIKWVSSFEEGLRLAREQGRPVFIDFFADWCLPCREMEVNTWRDARVIIESERFVAIKLDASREDSPAARLKIEKFGSFYIPFVAFYDSKGNYLEGRAIEGYADAETMLKVMQGIH